MDNHSFFEKISGLRGMTEILPYGDTDFKERIFKRLVMTIRSRFGNESHYMRVFLETDFSYHPSDEDDDGDLTTQMRRAWDAGKEKWINLMDAMLKEVGYSAQDEMI